MHVRYKIQSFEFKTEYVLIYNSQRFAKCESKSQRREQNFVRTVTKEQLHFNAHWSAHFDDTLGRQCHGDSNVTQKVGSVPIKSLCLIACNILVILM